MKHQLHKKSLNINSFVHSLTLDAKHRSLQTMEKCTVKVIVHEGTHSVAQDWQEESAHNIISYHTSLMRNFNTFQLLAWSQSVDLPLPQDLANTPEKILSATMVYKLSSFSLLIYFNIRMYIKHVIRKDYNCLHHCILKQLHYLIW